MVISQHRKTLKFGAVFVIFGLSLPLAGCQSAENPSAVPPPAALNAKVMISIEPRFTAGTDNTLDWEVDDTPNSVAADLSYRIEMSPDAQFLADVTTSPWLEATQYTFTNLIPDQPLYYRVIARNKNLQTTEWSSAVSSTQDDSIPVATVSPFGDDETSLLFDIEVEAEDTISGLAEINLWFRKNSAEWQLYGPVEMGITSFQTDQGGPHEFIAAATDLAGNQQELPALAQATAQVPEPIILVDGLGDEWDVTNAVLKHRIHLDFWAHGLGRHTIKPVVDPQMVYAGDPRFPHPNSQSDGLGVNYDHDQRFYSVNVLISREVANDVVNGVPIAVTY